MGEVPSLRFLIILPFLIDSLLLFIGIYFGAEQIRIIVRKASLLIFTSADTTAFHLFYYPMLAVFWIIFVVLYLYVVYLIASVLASPIYSMMADRTTRYLQARDHSNRPEIGAFALAVRMVWVSLARGVALLTIGGFLFAGSFVPGLNLVTTFVAFVLLAFDSADYAFEVHGFQLRDRFRFLRRHLVEFCGMGAFIGLTAFVPGLILFVMPFAVVGAASVVHSALNVDESKGARSATPKESS